MSASERNSPLLLQHLRDYVVGWDVVEEVLVQCLFLVAFLLFLFPSVLLAQKRDLVFHFRLVLLILHEQFQLVGNGMLVWLVESRVCAFIVHEELFASLSSTHEGNRLVFLLVLNHFFDHVLSLQDVFRLFLYGVALWVWKSFRLRHETFLLAHWLPD